MESNNIEYILIHKSQKGVKIDNAYADKYKTFLTTSDFENITKKMGNPEFDLLEFDDWDIINILFRG